MKMFLLILLVVCSTAGAQSEASTAAGPGCDCCAPKFLQPPNCIDFCSGPFRTLFCRPSLPKVPKFPKDTDQFIPRFPEIPINGPPTFINPFTPPSCGGVDPFEFCCSGNFEYSSDGCCAAISCFNPDLGDENEDENDCGPDPNETCSCERQNCCISVTILCPNPFLPELPLQGDENAPCGGVEPSLFCCSGNYEYLGDGCCAAVTCPSINP